ncbi:c-Myc-binding protein-like protein [Bienertia sinuspersici]
MEKEAKKEAFRKYLETSGVVDALTKGLVALYEQNNKPSSAIEFVQQKLGGPTVAEHDKLQSELSELQAKYNELLASHQETCKQVPGEHKHGRTSPTINVLRRNIKVRAVQDFFHHDHFRRDH